MNYTPFLRDRAYYENRYDRLVIESCRNIIKLNESYDKQNSEPSHGLSEDGVKRWKEIIKTLALYATKWELGSKRADKIQEWMDSDKKIDEFYYETIMPPPYCANCSRPMELMLKDLDIWISGKRHRILFGFRCEDCNTKRALWNDGEEHIIKKFHCKKCGDTNTKVSYESWVDSDIYKHTCSKCSFVEEELFEHFKDPAQSVDPDYEKDRSEFILSKEKLLEYQTSTLQIKNVVTFLREQQEEKMNKEHSEVQKPIEIRVIDIIDLKNLIAKELKKKKYLDIQFWMPSHYRGKISLELVFCCRDFDKVKLMKTLHGLLDNTNWVFAEQSIRFQLGTWKVNILSK
jgi:hypothetical protein